MYPIYFQLTSMNHLYLKRLSDILSKTVISLVITFMATNCLADDYPKSKLEKEMDEMGSVLNNGGIVFKPSKERSRDTSKTVGNVNKYLFKASIDALSFAPLVSADSIGGVVITDWYSVNKEQNTQVKITAFIRDDVISTEGLEVVAFERKKTNGQWSEAAEKKSLARSLEEKILRKARNLYLKESNK